MICPIHNEEMKKRTKTDPETGEVRVWYSHKLPDGTWCNGKQKKGGGTAQGGQQPSERDQRNLRMRMLEASLRSKDPIGALEAIEDYVLNGSKDKLIEMAMEGGVR